MSKINKLISNFSNHTFSSSGQIGSDYKEFEDRYQNVLKIIASNIDAHIINFSGGHYYFSTFMERDGKFIYLSISDVRHFNNDWKDKVLVRKAKNEKDFRGGRNHFVKVKNLEDKIDKLLG